MFFTEIFPYLGVIAMGAIVSIGLVLIKNERGNGHQSISEFAAASTMQRSLLIAALVVLSIPLYLWLSFWLLPTYMLPAWLYIVFFISYVSQIMLVCFPLVPRRGRTFSNLLHIFAGSTVAFGMLLLTTTLVISRELMVHPIAWAFTVLCLGYFVACVLGYLRYRNRSGFLFFENMYIILFALIVVTVNLVGLYS